jgi:hypothetical protein
MWLRELFNITCCHDSEVINVTPAVTHEVTVGLKNSPGLSLNNFVYRQVAVAFRKRNLEVLFQVERFSARKSS